MYKKNRSGGEIRKSKREVGNEEEKISKEEATKKITK